MNKPFRHISLLLLCAIVVLTCWQSYTVIHFYANQDQIEATFCENIDQPELNCHGQCHLKKQLQKQQKNFDDKTHYVNSSIIIFQAFENIQFLHLSEFNLELISYFNFQPTLTEGISKSLLDPPEIIS